MKSQKPIQLPESQKLCHKRAKGNVVGWFAHKSLTAHMKCPQKVNDRGKGQMASPKRMIFRKSSKRPLTPPPHFRKIILRISRQKCVISRQKCVCSFWRDCYILYDPISHEMHVVQQFNMVIGWKTYPEKTLLYHFHAEKALFKGPNFAI